MDSYQAKVENMLVNADAYHQAYYKAETFRGPSLFFHRRSLETRGPQISERHLEYIYATLVSWGMHRMGKGGSKMQSFERFRESVEQLRDKIARAQEIELAQMTEDAWNLLRDVFQGINVMASGASLVGNSKVMHHMTPNIIPPIDREYTLKYLRGNSNIENNLDAEWNLVRSIVSDFFIPVACDHAFCQKAANWMANQDKFPWDTSILKVIDNLVIGSRK